MEAVALDSGGQAEHSVGREPLGGLHSLHSECAAREGACLVEHHGAKVRHGVEHMAALEEDAPPRGRPDAAEIAQRNADDEGARTGHYEEDEGTPHPLGRRNARHTGPAERGGHKGHQRGQQHDHGRIDPCQSADEQFGGRLAGSGVLHQAEDAGRGALGVRTEGLKAQAAAAGDVSGGHLGTSGQAARQALARQGRRVEDPLGRKQAAVDGQALSGRQFEAVAGTDFLRLTIDRLPAALHADAVGAQGQQGADVAPRTVDGAVLQRLADGIEEHDGHALGILADGESPDRSDHHEEELVEDVAFLESFDRFGDHRPAHGEHRHQIPEKSHPRRSEPRHPGEPHRHTGHEHEGRKGRPAPFFDDFHTFCVCFCGKGRPFVLQPVCKLAPADRQNSQGDRISCHCDRNFCHCDRMRRNATPEARRTDAPPQTTARET